MVAAPNFVPLLFGAGWQPAIVVVQLFMLIGLSRLFNHLAGSCFSASGHPNWTLRISIWNGAANLLIVFIAVPFGLVAVVAASALRGLILLPLSWWLLKRLLGIDLAGYLRWIAAPGAASAAMVGAGWLIDNLLSPVLSDLAVLALQVGVFATLYSVFVFWMQPSLAGELKLFWQLLLGWHKSRQ